MNRDNFNKHVDTVIANCKAILGTKGEDYSYAEEDRLSNFKETAKEVSLTKYNVWYVYFNKGLSSIRRYITKGKVESENIHSRILDAINYLILLDAMIEEDSKNQLGNARRAKYIPQPNDDPTRCLECEIVSENTYRKCFTIRILSTGLVIHDVKEGFLSWYE